MANPPVSSAMMLSQISNLGKETKWAQRLGTAATLMLVGNSAYRVAGDLRTYYRRKRGHKITISSNSLLYMVVLRWLYQYNELKSNQVKIYQDHDGQVYRTLTEDTSLKFNWGGHQYDLWVEEVSSQLHNGPRSLLKKEIVFWTKSKEAKEDLVAHIEELGRKEHAKEGKFFLPEYGRWNMNEDVRLNRRIETVRLPPGVKEDLIGDFQTFFDAEDKYVSLGIPYHRGYLFYGPPGTGKSSLAQAIAHNFKKSLYYLALSSLKEDGDKDLITLVSAVPANSILLIEDIDLLGATNERSEQDKDPNDMGVSLEALLNVLDGALTPHGLIVIATTNDIGSLDDALVRPGRFDYQLEVGPVDLDQVYSLFELAYDRTDFDLGEPANGTTPAEIISIFKRNFLNPAEAVRIYNETLTKEKQYATASS